MSHLRRRASSLALALGVLLTGCGLASPSPSEPGPLDHPTDDTVILRVEATGGLMGPGFLFSSVPAFTVLGDGRVIVQGAQVELFPGPALPAIIVRQLTEAGIQAVLAEVAASGQFAADVRYDGAMNFLADAQDTVFTLRAGGREVTVSVYGLGNVGPDTPMQGITAAELAAHVALQQLAGRLATLESWLPASAWATADFVPYVPDAMRLLVRPADGEPADGSGLPFGQLPWPGQIDPATFGAVTASGIDRCGVVDADEAAAWYEALSAANQLTRFVRDGHTYQVLARQLIPGDPTDCEGLLL